MGRFVNPDNSAFQNAVNGEIYIDKSGLIELTNRFLGTPQEFICNSRPRRLASLWLPICWLLIIARVRFQRAF